MNIKYMTPGELVPYDKNPRINDQAVDLVANSIREFGFKQPIVIDRNNVIIAGHTRWKAARELGLERIPCIMADDLTPAQVKAYRLADNKVAEASEWDFDLLDEELQELDGLDIDMSDFGFVQDEVDTAEAVEDNYEPDIPTEPMTRRGQIWRLGDHRLMIGDSTSRQDVEELCDGNTMDLVVTDPPYNVAIENSQGMTIENDDMDSTNFQEFLTAAFENLSDHLKAGGAFYIWYASRTHMDFEQSLNNAGLEVREQLIWNKNSLVLGRQDYQWRHEPCLYGWKEGAAHYFINDRTQDTVILEDDIDFSAMKKNDLVAYLEELRRKNRDQTSVIYENKPTRNDIHPTMKPIALVGKFITNSSKSGWNVLDLFGGSGSTLMAAEQLGRTAFIMELDERFCDVIVKRWEDYTGQQAVRIPAEDVK